MKSKSWPQKGDKYYFVDYNLNVGSTAVTDNVHSVAYKVQIARHLAGILQATSSGPLKRQKRWPTR